MNVFRFIVQNHAEVLELTLEHLWMVAASTLLAVLIGIPLGILIARKPGWDKPVLGGANIIQTVPSLALFGFLLPVPWIGARSDRLAILALTLYALLPLIRNTYAGIKGVDRSVVEAGRGMGMTDRQLLFQVELPLALGVIIAGVRVAAVISVGLATIAAAIGAGGLGEYIFRGLGMVNNQLILAGAIPAAVLALLADVTSGMAGKTAEPNLEDNSGSTLPASASSPNAAHTFDPVHFESVSDQRAVRHAKTALWSARRISQNRRSSAKSSRNAWK